MQLARKIIVGALKMLLARLDQPKGQIVETTCAACGGPHQMPAICVGYSPSWELCSACRGKEKERSGSKPISRKLRYGTRKLRKAISDDTWLLDFWKARKVGKKK